jgi:hypothetical protein
MVATSTIGTKQLSYVFAPDSGDVVSYTRRHSRLRWPRGLGINWYGTQTAKWGGTCTIDSCGANRAV